MTPTQRQRLDKLRHSAAYVDWLRRSDTGVVRELGQACRAVVNAAFYANSGLTEWHVLASLLEEGPGEAALESAWRVGGMKALDDLVRERVNELVPIPNIRIEIE